MMSRPLMDVAWFQEGPGLRKWQWVDDGIKVINGRNIKLSGLLDVDNTDKYVSWSEFKQKYTHFEIESGDIVVSSSGTLGKVARISDQHLPMMMNTSVIRFRASDPDVLDDGFLFAWLRSPAFLGQALAMATGSAQQNFGPSHLKQMMISLPPLPIQKRIAAILSAYDDLIEVNTRRIAILEEMARRIYEEWFGRFARASFDVLDEEEQSQLQPLDAIANSPRESVEPEDAPKGTPYVGLEHLPRRSFTLGVTGSTAEITSTKLRFQPGDVLFGKIRPYFHKVAYARSVGICSSDTIVLRARELKWGPMVLLCAFSERFVEHATATSNGTKMPRADWKVIRRFAVPTVTDEQLEEFNRSVEPMILLAASLALQNTNLRSQRDLLLPRLVSGQLNLSEIDLPQKDLAHA
jgi:type I restriction enzyme, S subunit